MGEEKIGGSFNIRTSHANIDVIARNGALPILRDNHRDGGFEIGLLRLRVFGDEEESAREFFHHALCDASDIIGSHRIAIEYDEIEKTCSCLVLLRELFPNGFQFGFYP